MRGPFVLFLASLIPTVSQAAKSKAKATDCSAADEKVAKLTAEVESLRKQLAAATGQQCASAISVTGAVTKTSSIASDVVQHLLQKTEIDEKVVSVVSSQAEVARGLTSKFVDQITAHPCGTNYDECKKHITGLPIYKEHVAPHMDVLATKAQPYVDTAKVYVAPTLEAAMKAYGTAKDKVEVHVVPTLKQGSTQALSHGSKIASSMPGHVEKLLSPAFEAFSTASPQHREILPKDPIDRLLLICVLLFVIYNLFFVARLFFKVSKKLAWIATSILIQCGIKVPFKLTKMWISWGFWFGTGFYVCGLCRKRKAAGPPAEKNTKKAKAPDAKAEKAEKTDKKVEEVATLKELVQMLEKTKEKGKLDDGVARLVAAAKNGKPLQGPAEMKNKQVTKDVLKKALAKFKEVDIKKFCL